MPQLSDKDLKRNRNLLLFYFLYTLLNGSLRKWVFAGSEAISTSLFIVQIILPIVVIVMMRRERSVFTYQPLLPLSILLVIMAANPLNMTFLHGIFGFVLHIGFWLLMLTYIRERDAFPVKDLLGIFIAASFIEVILTFIQFSLPTTHFINRLESGDDGVGFGDGVVRVIGSFSYIAGYGSFLCFAGMLVWALMVESKRPMWVLFGLAAGALVSTFMNGSRSILAPFAICLVFGLISYGSTPQKIKAVFFIVGIAVLGLAFGLGSKLTLAETAFKAFSERIEYGQKSGEANRRTANTFIEVTEFRGRYPLFGVGLGATYQAANNKWGRSSAVIEYGFFEEEPARVVIEGGYTLFFVRFFLMGYLLTQLRIPLLLSIPICAYFFFFTQTIFNAYQSAFMFFGLIVLDRIYTDKKEAISEQLSVNSYQ